MRSYNNWNAVDTGPRLSAPSWEFLFGTDIHGRDVFSRIIYGDKTNNFYQLKNKLTQAITKNSSCANCFHYRQTSCSRPSEASDTMVCFDWKK